MGKVFVLLLASLIGILFTFGTASAEQGCCELPDSCYSGDLDPQDCINDGGTWHPGQTCCGAGAPNQDCYTEQPLEYGCCKHAGGCFSGTSDPEKCRVCYGGTWHSGQTCCGAGTPNQDCYTEQPLEYGCCQYGTECYSGTVDPARCSVCYGGSWHSGWDCEGGECVPEASTVVLFAVGLLSLAGYIGLRRKEN